MNGIEKITKEIASEAEAEITSVLTEAEARASAVAEEYKLSWALMGSPEDYQARMDAYRTALYNAGLQDVIDEYQAQVNEFLAANGK